MTAWGATVLGWLDLSGDERVLDAGCGTGQVTALLRDRLPHGEVVALDGSSAMIERARERLGDDRVDVRRGRPRRSRCPSTRPVDAVLSTATFHWIPDHDALFREPRRRARGRAASSRPNAAAPGTSRSIEAALRDMGESFEGRKHYATPEATQGRLRSAGFTDVECWLHDEPTPLPAEDLEPYLEAICLGDHVATMAPADRRAFVHEVASGCPRP